MKVNTHVLTPAFVVHVPVHKAAPRVTSAANARITRGAFAIVPVKANILEKTNTGKQPVESARAKHAPDTCSSTKNPSRERY